MNESNWNQHIKVSIWGDELLLSSEQLSLLFLQTTTFLQVKKSKLVFVSFFYYFKEGSKIKTEYFTCEWYHNSSSKYSMNIVWCFPISFSNERNRDHLFFDQKKKKKKQRSLLCSKKKNRDHCRDLLLF